MSSSMKPIIVAKFAAAAIAKGKVVKVGADDEHVQVCSAGTDKSLGITQNASLAAEDILEVAQDGGGKGLAGGTIASGDLLTSDSNGALVATTTANDKIIAQAMEAAVANDLFEIQIVKGNY